MSKKKKKKVNKKKSKSTTATNIGNNKKTTKKVVTKKSDNIKHQNAVKTKLQEKNKENVYKSNIKNLNKKKINIKYILLSTIIIFLIIGGYFINQKILQEKQMLEIKLAEIKDSFNNTVITNKETVLYKKNKNKYIESGTIGKDVYLYLNKDQSDYDNGFFAIINLSDSLNEQYYIYYKDIEKTNEDIITDKRYINYIPYNKTIITNDTFSLYDQNNNLIYKLNSKLELPIIINKDNSYGIEFDNKLLYIKNEDIKEIVSKNNTNKTNTSGISVLNYHFVYDDSIDTCNQVICHTKKQFQSHLEYIKNNNIFTPTLKELEMYLDRFIQLPKSVVITIDDGWLTEESTKLLNKYELNGTVFLITSEYSKNPIESKYVEVHSHTHKMHKVGDCPGGYGGGIKCLSEEYIQKDLKTSRERLNNTTYFCYPFYEYNNYSISQLKKAGFTMAFAGYNANGQLKAKPGIDKFQIPRYVIQKNTSVNQLKNIIG